MKEMLIVFGVLFLIAAITLPAMYAGRVLGRHLHADLAPGIVMGGGEVIAVIAMVLVWIALTSFISGFMVFGNR